MTEHIEWARAPHVKFADASWIEENADEGNDDGNVALLFDTGGSSIAIYGTPEELRETVGLMIARLDTFAPIETAPVADETPKTIEALVREYDRTRAEFAALHARDQTGSTLERYEDAIFSFAHDIANLTRKATSNQPVVNLHG